MERVTQPGCCHLCILSSKAPPALKIKPETGWKLTQGLSADHPSLWWAWEAVSDSFGSRADTIASKSSIGNAQERKIRFYS